MAAAIRRPRQGRADHRRRARHRRRRGAAAREARREGVAGRPRARAARAGRRRRSAPTRRLVRGGRDRLGRAASAPWTATVERFGGIDVVIANAGIAPFGTVATIDPDAFERTIEVNLLGVWRTVRTALPHVVARQGYILSDRFAGGRAAPADARALRGHQGGRRGVLRQPRAPRSPTPARASASPTSASSTPTWCATASTARPRNVLRDATPGPVQQDRAAVGRRQGDRARRRPAAPTRCGRRAGCCR